jgi:hypothetical protein
VAVVHRFDCTFNEGLNLKEEVVFFQNMIKKDPQISIELLKKNNPDLQFLLKSLEKLVSLIISFQINLSKKKKKLQHK